MLFGAESQQHLRFAAVHLLPHGLILSVCIQNKSWFDEGTN
jgi:hypothetical protein